MTKHLLLIVFILTLLCSCTKKIKPYKCGAVLSYKQIKKSFTPLVALLELKPGMVYADVGAAGGAYDVMISTLTKDVTYYVQDIDTACLNQTQLDKILTYYSAQSQQNLRQKNKFVIKEGAYKYTNLPNNTFDVIYTNATFHAFSYKTEMMTDIYKKLKPGGYLFIRDGLAKTEKAEYCPDEKCANKLVKEADLLSIVTSSGFRLVKKVPDFQGYPIFKFKKE